MLGIYGKLAIIGQDGLPRAPAPARSGKIPNKLVLNLPIGFEWLILQTKPPGTETLQENIKMVLPLAAFPGPGGIYFYPDTLGTELDRADRHPAAL